jgi:lysophospholipase L1-like esterase
MRKFGLISVVLVLAMLLAPASALAAGRGEVVYTALGDSIAVGTGGTDSIGYVDLLADRLARGHRHVTLNDAMCVEGMTSAELLALVSDPANAGSLAGADIITVSIGGNDILQPVIAFVGGQDPMVWNSMSQEQKIAALSLLAGPLYEGVEHFAVNWAYTIGAIRTVNPTARVFVNTLYNPFRPGDGLFEAVDPFVRGINDVIAAASPYAGYEVIDVYTAFGEYHNPRKPLVHDLASPVALHPTDRGYMVIFNLHKDALNKD